MPDTTTPLGALVAAEPTVLWNDSADPLELRQSIEWGAVGATCNPVIALAAVNADLPRWSARLHELAVEHDHASESELGWLVVEEISKEAAAMLEPAFDRYGGRNGRLSMQTDPRLFRNPDALVAQAVHFDSLARNVIVKIPATAKGIDAIEEASYRGVSINVTVSFSVAQAVAAGEAIERGIARREAEGHDCSSMGPVVTLMVGRLDDWMKECYARDGASFDAEHLDWAGVAAFKRAHAEFTQRGLRARMLAAAYRNMFHFSELIGADVVLSPPFVWQQKFQDAGVVPERRFDEPVEPAIMRDLLSLPEFVRAYEPDGMSPQEFVGFGATRKTLRQFLEADEALDHIVRDILLPAP